MIRSKPVFSPAPLLNSLILIAFFSGSLFSTGRVSGSTLPDLPVRLGRVIYRQNPDSDRQIYIVAQSHRSLASGQNGSDTARVQSEIYRIGEWLIRHRGVGILLPEGYFRQRTKAADAAASGGNRSSVTSEFPLSDADLLDRLVDPNSYENAATLLHANYNVTLCQIEDWQLYTRVCRLMLELKPLDNVDRDLAYRNAPLAYQQKKRSAVLLHNIPTVLDQLNGIEKSGTGAAILTVGLTHVEEIISFLKTSEARIPPLPGLDTEFSGYYCELTPLKTYGITIILPPSLANNRELVRLILPGNVEERTNPLQYSLSGRPKPAVPVRDYHGFLEFPCILLNRQVSFPKSSGYSNCRSSIDRQPFCRNTNIHFKPKK